MSARGRSASGIGLVGTAFLAAVAVQAPVTTGLAQETDESDDAPVGIIDAGHARASAGVRGLATWIDGFFSDKNYQAELNESWARVRLDTFAELYEGTEAKAKARLYLKLPALDERLRLEVLSADEADDENDSATDAARPPPPDGTLDRITAALSYFFRNDERRSLRARIGLDFDGTDPDPFVGLRYREHVSLDDDWNFRFVQRLRYFSLAGTESRTVLGLDHALPEDWLFRWEVDGIWREETPDYLYGVNFAVFQPLDAKSAVEYQLLNAFRTNPHRLDEVTLRLRYRRQIWRKWLILEASPQLTMPRERNYDPVPAFLLRFEVIFGG